MAYDINSALERLEQNLKDVDTARKQVSAVVSSSKELQEVVDSYIRSMNSVYKELVAWESDFRDKSSQISLEFVEAIQRLNTSCSKIVDGFKLETDVSTQSFAEGTKKPLSEFENSNKIFATSITQLTSLYADFKSATAEVKVIEIVLNQIAKDLKTSQDDQDKELSKIKSITLNVEKAIGVHAESIKEACSSIRSDISSATRSLTTLNDKVDKITTQIDSTTTKISNSQKETNQELDLLRAELTKAVNVNRWLIIAGIIIAIILHFV